MAMISLRGKASFWGHIKDYDWKGKFLVVEVEIADTKENRVLSWDIVESVYVTDEEMRGK